MNSITKDQQIAMDQLETFLIPEKRKHVPKLFL